MPCAVCVMLSRIEKFPIIYIIKKNMLYFTEKFDIILLGIYRLLRKTERADSKRVSSAL